jgi:hypothetical protein
MKTDQLHDQDPAPSFPKIVSIALGRLKKRLRRHYQKAYPDSGEIIDLVLNEEEAKAQQLSFFPHLIFPDLVDAHFAKLPRKADKMIRFSPTRHSNQAVQH